MKKYLRIIFIFFVFLSFVSGVYAIENKPAPDFQLQDLSDKPVFLSDYKGKGVILFFWTTWCPYCRDELRALEQENPVLSRAGVEVLAINVGEPRHKVENFIKSRDLSFRVLLDKDSTVAGAYQLMGVPTYYVVNRSGEIVSAGNHFPQDALKVLIPASTS
ncbi:MAG: redoxin domain-containing protein [Candidatus Omnitrophota bacterium]